MNYTENYQLPQWQDADRVLMEDFNDAMSKVDQGMGTISKVAVGSYIGTGTYGSSAPTRLDLEFPPKVVAIVANAAEMLRSGTVLVAGQTKSSGIGCAYSSSSALNLTVSWEGNHLSWYAVNAEHQLNESGVSYFFFALG